MMELTLQVFSILKHILKITEVPNNKAGHRFFPYSKATVTTKKTWKATKQRSLFCRGIMGNKWVCAYHMLVHIVQLSRGFIPSQCVQALCENNTTSIEALSEHQQSGEHMVFPTVDALCYRSYFTHISVSSSGPILSEQERFCVALNTSTSLWDCLWHQK